MQAFFITLYVFIGLFFCYFLYVLLVVFLFQKKLFGTRGNDPDNPCYLRYEDYESWLKRSPYQTGYYGKAIRGYLYQEKGRDTFLGFILLSHGFFGTHIQYLADIALLCQNGYLVLAFDQYGVGLSEGASQVSLANGIYVLENVIRDVEKRNLNQGLPLILYGHSWGAYCACGALKNHPEIQKAVLRSGPVDPIQAGNQLLEMKKPALYRSILPLDRLCYFLLLGRRHLLKATRGPKKNQATKILTLHAEDDPLVPFSASISHYYQKHPQSNVSFFLQKEGGHNSLITSDGYHNYEAALKRYQEIASLPDETEKTRKKEMFIRSLNRVKMYPYNQAVCEAILSFLRQS